jgi:drug/metabolite transporter (DMT)-like permease
LKIIKYAIPYILLSAFSYEFVKNGLEYSSPLPFMAIRYLIGGISLLPLAKKIVINKDIIFLTILTTLSSGLWAYGLLYVSPSESAVLSYSMPLFALPLSLILIKEKPEITETIGITIGFLGVIIYSIPLGFGYTLIGLIFTLVNAFFWASFTVFFRFLKNMDPFVVNSSQLIIGSMFFFGFSFINFRLDFTYNFIADLIYVSILGGSITFILWNQMLRIEKVGKVTVLSFSVPLITTLIDGIETMSLPSDFSIVGIGIMFSGILLSRIKGRKKKLPLRGN